MTSILTSLLERRFKGSAQNRQIELYLLYLVVRSNNLKSSHASQATCKSDSLSIYVNTQARLLAPTKKAHTQEGVRAFRSTKWSLIPTQVTQQPQNLYVDPN